MLEEYLRAGHLDAHLPRARDLYRRRAGTLTDSLERHFDGLATWTVPRGGFFSWLRVPGVDTMALAVVARESKVAFVPGAGFFAAGRDDEHLRLSYSRISESDIEEGVVRLAAAVRTLRERP